MTPARLQWNLENWAEYMSAASHEGDYSSRAGSGLGYSGKKDFDTMVHCAMLVSAEAVEAVLRGMVPRLRDTIHNRHLNAVFIVRGDHEANYREALSILGSGLDRRGIY